MMGRSHLALNGALTAAGLTWVGVLRDPLSVPAAAADSWVHGSATTVAGFLGQSVPSWLGVHPVSEGAAWLWAWLFPLWGANPALSVGYLVIAVLLLGLGTLAPDADSKDSTLGRRLPFRVPGPHRGLLHTDWFLIALFALSLWQPARLVFWLWLGAWLHCEMDGLSRAGRVRFYPLTKHKLIALSGGGVSVARVGRHVGLYRVGQLGESVLLATMLAGAAALVGAAVLL